jgi:N-acetylmuramoyl-L-alanine amidase
MRKWVGLGLVFIVLGCMSGPYKTTNRAYKKQAKAFAKTLSKTNLTDSLGIVKADFWAGTTNFNMRKPNMVVIHHTAQNSCEQTLKTFTITKTQVSAHYVICEDGTIHHMLNDYLRAWHAGLGKWGNITDVNSSSIGIELDNDGFEAFKEPQILALEKLLANLKKTYGIPASNFIGHADIAPTRKNDPNVNFDWERLAKGGYGKWYADTAAIQLPSDFQAQSYLKMIGYNSPDTVAVIKSFKRKYLKQDQSGVLNDADNKILYAVWREMMK